MEINASSAQRLAWYVRRLRSMGVGELLWRAQQGVPRSYSRSVPPREILCDAGVHGWTDSLDKFREAVGRPVLLDRRRASAIAERQPELVANVIDSAQQVLNHRFQFFGYPIATLTQPIDWNYDPISETRWPAGPSRRIDHRSAAGDVKWIWELNRLQHLPWLAQAWLFTGDSRYSTAAFEQLDTWMDQNPPGQGIAWRGAFEAGLRAISISIALQGLRDAPELSVERYRRVVTTLAYSALRCWRERSRFSSANNHLIGEMAGLATVSMMFPELPSAALWERQALRTLSIEAGKQILPDGVGAEQSVAYQMATVELLHLVCVLLIERDGTAPDAITGAISRSSGFLSAVVGDIDPDPRYGDSDQEFALRLGTEQIRTVREHLTIVDTLGRCCHRTDSDPTTLSAQWYRSMTTAVCPTGSTHSISGSGGQQQRPDASFFAQDGGLVVLRRSPYRITMDVGPLGYLSIAAHGHADALSVTVSIDGEGIIGDPGTGSYYRHPQWRSVMRGTRAHPTVSVDGQDQSVIGGPFLWSRHAHTRLKGIDLRAGVVDAEHDGYTRLPGRVTHRRWLIAPPEDRVQLVIDLVTGTGAHEVRTSWPIHPSVEVLRVDRRHTLTRRQQPILQMLHAATSPFVFDDDFGDEVNGLGWWSDRLETREPTWWLAAVCHAELPIVIATLITPMDGAATTDLTVGLLGDTIEVTWIEDAKLRAVAIGIRASVDVELRS